MINNFKNIGKAILEKSGYYATENEIEKRKIFLFHQSLVPFIKKDNNGNDILDGKAICFNFSLREKQFEITLSDRQLIETNRDYFMGFRLGASNDKKKFLTTNNIDNIYVLLFKDSFSYIDEKRKNKRSRDWIDSNVNDKYRVMMNSIFKDFYTKDQHFIRKNNKKVIVSYLNYNLLIGSQKNVFLKIFHDEFDDDKSRVSINELYNRFINKFYFSTVSKDTKYFPSLFMILFDGEDIFNYKDREFANDYINMCYYDLQQRFITEKRIKEKVCHICREGKDVVQNLPLPMKFYGTTNYLNFENLSNSSTYKSFAMCNDCLIEVQTGMKYVINNFSKKLFDISCYLIPHIEQYEDLNNRVFESIIRILKTYKQEYKTEIGQIKSLLNMANRRNVLFDLMFYFSPANSQQFDVHKLISNIELNKLLYKLSLFDDYSRMYALAVIGDKNNSLTISDLRYYLFPSFLSHGKKLDFNIYGKNLLNFLEGFLTGKKIDYYEMVKRFMEIYRKRMNNDKLDTLAPFKMILALTIFIRLNILTKGAAMKEGASVTDVLKDEYRLFFEKHSEIYVENKYHQGLFLMGTLISEVIKSQRKKSGEKGKKMKIASTFMSKINLAGLNVRRIPSLINKLKDYCNIYSDYVYEEQGIWGNIMDRLQGIEKSTLKPDEVVFYLLTGISFADYLRMKRAYENANKNDNSNGGN